MLYALLSFLSWLQIFLSRLKCVMDWQSVYLLGKQPAMSKDFVIDVCHQLCLSIRYTLNMVTMNWMPLELGDSQVCSQLQL